MKSRIFIAQAFSCSLALVAAFGCRPPAAVEEDYRAIDPVKLAGRIETLFKDPSMATERYWKTKPALTATFAYPLRPSLTAAEREELRRLKGGEFRPSKHFEWKPLGVPPPWDENPFNNPTYDFYRHSLCWIEPLVDSWASEGDAESLRIIERVLRDWIRTNSKPPGASELAWGDHSASYRLRILCWFWEIYRGSDDFDWEFGKLLLAVIYQHGLYMTDAEAYRPTTNHALHMDGSLLAATATLPEFTAADRWRTLVEARLESYMRDNFSPEGYHLEQSPSYHWYVISKVGEILTFMRENRLAAPPALLEKVTQAISVLPTLIRRDNKVPNVGDSGSAAPRGWQRLFKEWTGLDAPAACSPTVAAPRPDAGGYYLSFRAGYAIFTSYLIGAEKPAGDTYALFRCNSWYTSSHCHCDALSFELYALKREWLVDSGRFNYSSSPERLYMRSAKAHSVVLVDGREFEFEPIELIDSGRTEECDFVAARHELPTAYHTRRFEYRPPLEVRVTDRLEARDDRPHQFAQLFHVAPGLKVEIVSPNEARLVAEDGKRCVITQSGGAGEWTIIEGQKQPFMQGWYSREFGQAAPAPVLYYTISEPTRACDFSTRIIVIDAENRP